MTLTSPIVTPVSDLAPPVLFVDWAAAKFEGQSAGYAAFQLSGWTVVIARDVSATHLERLVEELGGEVQVLPPAVRHSLRFRRVSNGYPRAVTEAYSGDIERAARDSDGQVAAMVATWELAQGLEPRDWAAIGAEERDDDAPPTA